jgi:hypothetical protein
MNNVSITLTHAYTYKSWQANKLRKYIKFDENKNTEERGEKSRPTAQYN